MRWQGGKQSDNLEDRRRMNPKAAVVGGGGMLIILLIGALLGVNPEKLQQMIGDPALNPQAQVGGGEERELNTDEERIGEFVGTILQFNEDVWSEQFRRAGETYEPPKMVLFYDSVSTGCGQAPSAVGPFYCPADRKVYLDPTFFLELEEKLGGSQAEFSQAYVISHEIGHHVQNLLGYSALVDKKRRTVSKAEYNRWSVRLELQADYLAGVWAHYGQQKFNFIEPGDIDSAMKTAKAIGDDRLQRNSRGFTSPESYTHGTSAQRAKWFRLGLQTGDLEKLKEIFEIPYEEL